MTMRLYLISKLFAKLELNRMFRKCRNVKCSRFKDVIAKTTPIQKEVRVLKCLFKMRSLGFEITIY